MPTVDAAGVYGDGVEASAEVVVLRAQRVHCTAHTQPICDLQNHGDRQKQQKGALQHDTEQNVKSDASSQDTESSAVGSKVVCEFEQFKEISAEITLAGNIEQIRAD